MYLFEKFGKKLYLTLNQGITKLKEDFGKNATDEARKRAQDIRRELHLEDYTNKINLNSQTSLGQGYEDTCIAAIEYDIDSLPNEETVTNDLDEFMTIYDNYKEYCNGNMSDNNLTEGESVDSKKISISLPKPFLLLAGISGTGKTRFVCEQADAAAAKFGLSKDENYCLVPVRPDWHEPSDLLGYISRINGVSYIPTGFLEFAVKALRKAVESVDNGSIIWKSFDEVAPYWLCLDEMNLAPVEQYFADYLSILETRSFTDNMYESAPLLSPSVFKKLGDSASLKLLSDLGFKNYSFNKNSFVSYLNNNDLSETTVKTYLNAFDKIEDNILQNHSVELFNMSIENAKKTASFYHLRSNENTDSPEYKWVKEVQEIRQNGDVSGVASHFVKYCESIEQSNNSETTSALIQYILDNGIPLPPNLIVAGTVNMDETTHGFSRKVIDRALTIDFQEFFPNNFDSFFDNQDKPVLLSFPRMSQASRDALAAAADAAADGSKSLEFIKSLNSILMNTPFELAYRALNELLLSVISFAPYKGDDAELRLQAVWDDFLMQKVLPRIEGDSQKLKSSVAVPAEENTKYLPDPVEYGKGTLLHDLYSLLGSRWFSEIWQAGRRPDLLRSTENRIGCRSKKKLEWMMRRLKTSHFTDFWV